MDKSTPPLPLELKCGGIWQGSRMLPLRPMEQGLLTYLIERPGQLVTIAELRTVL